MYFYAQIDEQGYCIGISCLSETVNDDNLIIIESYDNSFLERKYDKLKGEWTDEYLPKAPPKVSEHQMITKQTYSTVEVSSYDNLTNMDMLIGIDEKLNLIMEHLGLIS